MADKFAEDLATFDAQVAKINDDIRAIDEENLALEAQEKSIAERKNANVLKRGELRRAREAASRQRESLGVRQRVASLEDAAASDRQAAAKALAELEAKNKEADALLAKLKEATPPQA